jgi:hypothetical protein
MLSWKVASKTDSFFLRRYLLYKFGYGVGVGRCLIFRCWVLVVRVFIVSFGFPILFPFRLPASKGQVVVGTYGRCEFCSVLFYISEKLVILRLIFLCFWNGFYDFLRSLWKNIWGLESFGILFDGEELLLRLIAYLQLRLYILWDKLVKAHTCSLFIYYTQKDSNLIFPTTTHTNHLHILGKENG